jgi:hypothetical protein
MQGSKQQIHDGHFSGGSTTLNVSRLADASSRDKPVSVFVFSSDKSSSLLVAGAIVRFRVQHVGVGQTTVAFIEYAATTTSNDYH